MRRDLNIIKASGTFVLYSYIIRYEQMFVNGFERKTQTFVRGLLLFTHTCPVTEFAVASHLNTANSCCHHVFLRYFRFQKYLPGNSNRITPRQEKGDVRRLCTRSPFSFPSISLLFYFCIASIRACTYSSSIFVVPSIPSRLLLIERS